MHSKTIIPILIFVLNSISCKPSYHAIDLANTSFVKEKEFSKEDLNNWHLKDIEKDSLPGISLERTYTELLKKRKADTVIVAVLDSEININND